MTSQRSYTELCRIPTFRERLEYLRLCDRVGNETFGYDRWLNQSFYASYEWKRIRRLVIERDLGCDLAVPGELIFGKILVHHLNPIRKEDIVNGSDAVFDMDNLVSASLHTHNAIHYGTEFEDDILERTPNDTCPWRN